MNKRWTTIFALLVASATGAVCAQEIKGNAKAAEGKVAMCIGCHGIVGYKASFPDRTLAHAQDGSPLTNKARRKDYFKIVNAMDTVLARIKRNKTSFSSLQELDNYFASSLKTFD